MNFSNERLREGLIKIAEKYAILLVLVILVVVASTLAENFLSVRNIFNILRQITVVGILAMGEMIVLISGMLDLSNGSVLALAGVLSVSVYMATGSLLIAFILALVVGVIANIINGIAVTKFDTPPFIATLAMMASARGLALLYTDGRNIYGIGDYSVFGQGAIFDIPIPIIFFGLIILISLYILNHTKLGRSIYAIGGNEKAALASGINIRKNKMLAYIINGVFVGLAGVIFMGRVNAGIPMGGQGYEFDALTAAILGGTSLSGGIGTVWGTLTGALIVGVLNNFMNLMGVSSYVQQILQGVIILTAVIYDVKSSELRKALLMGESSE